MNNFSYLTELNDSATHVIVWFMNIRRQDKKSCIDLVPREWLSKVKRSWLCKYPPKLYYNKVQEWSKESKSPESTWKNYSVKLLKNASNFDEGQRRIARMSETTVLLSSEISDISAEEWENTEVESDISHKSSDLELESFVPTKIVKKKITDDSVSSSSDESPSVFRNKKNFPAARLNKENDKRKKINQNTEKSVNTFEYSKSRKRQIENSGENSSSIRTNDCNTEFTEVVANACYEQVKILLHKKMDNIKKSILYDIRKGFEELKNNLLLNLPQKDDINPISALKQVIGIKLPTSTLDEFNNLDLLIETDEKREALRSLLERYVEVAPIHKKAIHDTLSAVMDKRVQMQFTAFGRQKNESKKLNFSGTNIYNLLMDILISKFGEKEKKNIHSSMSRWFSGAIDRCGGRKERENEKNNTEIRNT